MKVEGDFDSIIIAGLGGSGHPGDLLNALHLPSIPLTVHRNYGLPPSNSQNPLVIASSYSGNTEETISAFNTAKERGYTCMVNTAGGKLEEFAKEQNLAMSKIDYPGMQPRHTLFASFMGIATALANSGYSADISEDATRVAKILEEKIPTLEAPAKELAKKLKGKTPIFTASSTLGFVAKNFKIQTNENAKTPAFWNEFPELNHNEMIGMTQPQAKFHTLILRDAEEHPRINVRMDVTKELYEKWGVEVSEFQIVGDTLLEKMMYGLSFGLWTTYFLAEEYGIDPVPVGSVEEFKQKLEEKAGKI